MEQRNIMITEHVRGTWVERKMERSGERESKKTRVAEWERSGERSSQK